MEIFNFELGEKLDQYSRVKFDEESECDGFESEKISRDPLSDPFSWARRIVRETEKNSANTENFRCLC